MHSSLLMSCPVPIPSLQDRKPQAFMPRLGHKTFGEIRLTSPGALSSHELGGADFKGTDSIVRPQLYHLLAVQTWQLASPLSI